MASRLLSAVRHGQPVSCSFVSTRNIRTTTPYAVSMLKTVIKGGFKPVKIPYAPGTAPRTEEERIAAANKYGMPPEDYQCDPTGTQGDYPMFPKVPNVQRSENPAWDFSDVKENYGDAIHVDSDWLGADTLDGYRYGGFGVWENFKSYGTLVGVIFAFAYLYPTGDDTRLPKQYPGNLWLDRGGSPEDAPVVKHYTFEPAD
ncbi:NADH dehydrogenase [ubiquinone] 1 beta subcomplex subunit 8, mitochondrial isoform X2 [Lingula anatina]|uniref:NADH dehydrogenase [ubiquinone] 1 beta subcomplex subunit 8, mitochondrial isoform X1 n=1 Tax=Lingula anatina TaxID=7574 RepID=A0A1S3I7I4_LINAN|nr:NADH dehydrogenase [ubiquinone] 1 beta subcomplex subunit 8, mitochondrial isoform X1 [Lingula anatina]XP_013394213.1 NADH dehydrogenase [ubiquinone] 1 beta subcomplex subunit 8, mitochondrial isoform X2 [Lingula anatina]|eukprot:XP_013394212.1 NADH dehydrogenase [ubiquinone] 1 beta subcomplex subunit 8, mitochondrial isoform X1 [Lingula anatina]